MRFVYEAPGSASRRTASLIRAHPKIARGRTPESRA
jgi:hypothetical protein